MTCSGFRDFICLLLLSLLSLLLLTSHALAAVKSDPRSQKISDLFEFHVADLQLSPQGSVNFSVCCPQNAWIPPDLCSTQCRLLLEARLLPVAEVAKSNANATEPVALLRTGVIYTQGKLYNSTLDFRINIYEKWKRPLHLHISLFHRSPVGDAIPLARLPPLTIKGRRRTVWTTQTMQETVEATPALRVTLSYRFACPPDYYGDACERYCAPRDSLLGHYTCDPKDGRIVCLSGWRGSQCTEAVCINGCFHGTCDSPGNCKCREGWEGEACDQCIPLPGCSHGSCKLNWTLGQHEPFTCECHSGWSGMLCTIDTQYCSNHPTTCLHGGVCHNTPTETSPGYVCQCPLGYDGYHCESPNQDCRVHSCNGNGICQTNGTCTCSDGFYGSNCQFNQTECNETPCQGNKSICESLTETSESSPPGVSVNFRCKCQPGLSGMNCEYKIRQCDKRPCLHGGKCVELTQNHDGYQCVCLPGYRGRHCELSDSACQHLPCANGGQCVDRAHHVECRCLPGWTGPTCRQNINECTTPVCKNGAGCRDRPGTFECLCTPGWTGHDCSIPIHNTTLDPIPPPSTTSRAPPPAPLLPSTASPACISACGEEGSEIAWPQTSIIIRCGVVTSIVVLIFLLILLSLLLILRRRRVWRHTKSEQEELQGPTPPSRPRPVYWNSRVMPEPLLICASGDSLMRHKTLFSGASRPPLSRKEGLCLEKSLMYESTASSSIVTTSPHIMPLCGPSVHHHAIVYACQTPPPPYEDSVQNKGDGREKVANQS